ncbi:MAG TPA: MlaD family protein [Caulobacteraceae bacterium]|jgi:phospholipid/cholesterol/gamma-HCH transport system substrate-binding protein
MERNANYALIGLVTTVLFVGLIFFVVWLARLQFAEDFDEYDIIFQGPVRGLSTGGEVHFSGIRVGEVTDIELDPRNPNRVIARVRLEGDTPVRRDSVAELEPFGITGVNYVQLSAGNPRTPLLEPTRQRPIPVIRSKQSAIAGLLEGGGTVLERTVEALNRVNRLLSDQNIAVLNQGLRDVQGVTAELNANRAVIGETRLAIRDAQLALASIDQTADEITRLASDSRNLVNGDAKRALADVASTAQEIKASAAEVRASINQITEPTAEFARTGLPQITATVVQLQSAAESVERLTDEINRSPTGLLSRGRAREVEVAR